MTEATDDMIDTMCDRMIETYMKAIKQLAVMKIADKEERLLTVFDAPLVLARTALGERIKMYNVGDGNKVQIREDVIRTTWQLIQYMATMHHVLITKHDDDNYDMSPDHVIEINATIDPFLEELHNMRRCGKLVTVHERTMDKMDHVTHALDNIVKSTTKKED